MAPTVFLFDLDETLVTYDPAPVGIFEATCRDHGVDPTEELLTTFGRAIREHTTAFHHDPFLAAARDLVATHDLPVDPERFTGTLLRTELASMTVPDGVHETLTTLARESPIAVVTGGHGPVQRRKLDRAGLSEPVDLLVSPVEARAFKPDPALLRLAADTLPGERYVVVGDSVDGDLEPALELGFETVLVGAEDERATHTLAGPSEVSRLPALFGLSE